MKRTLLALLLCLCVALLAACRSEEAPRFDYYVDGSSPTQGAQNTQADNNPSGNQPSGTINFDDGSYDPASEEGRGDDLAMLPTEAPTQYITPAPTIRSQFAGATPVPIDPIDKPTPTVVPPLTFTYTVYDATNLGLSFEGPIGWQVDASASDTYVIYNPDPSMDYMATLTLRATPVSSDYGTSALQSEVKTVLSNVGAYGFAEFNPSNTASRNLIGHEGVYANYTGTLDNGVQVAGRIHVTCVNRVLYTVHITYPRAYTDTYVDGVYHKLRDTITITK